MIESVFPKLEKYLGEDEIAKRSVNTEGFPVHSTPLAAGPALYSWAVSIRTAHLLCMCMSGSFLKPDASALAGSNKEELPACKINSP